jgi:superfamily II helicase
LDPLGRFLKEMGVTDLTPQDALKVTRGLLPEETEIIVLECKQA